MSNHGDALGPRRSSRRDSVTTAQSRTEADDHVSMPTGGLLGRKHILSDTSESEDTPTSSLSLRRRGTMKRMKKELMEEEGAKKEGGDGVEEGIRPKRSSKLRSAGRSDFRERQRGVPSRHRGRGKGKGKGKVRMEHSLPVRRSKREKRLVFASMNQSEMDRQLFNLEAGFPVLHDFSEDELDPYEKMLSPHRLRRKPHTSSTPSTIATSLEDPGGKGMTLRSSSQQGLDVGGEEQEEEEEEQEEENGEAEEEEEDEESGSEDEGEGGYFLRKRRPVIYQYQPVIQVVEEDTPPKRRSRSQAKRDQPRFYRPKKSASSQAYQPHRQPTIIASRKRAVHHQGSSTSSSGSDSDEARFRRRKSRSMQKARNQCLPMNFVPEDVTQGVVRDRARIGSSLADVDPMNVDRDVTFDSVGGLQHHIRALKEMIIFPLLYPEVFDRFKIQPPRGVLFHGAPGCGKTLVARALANECSKGGKKVAFFMRKGADCLSKWVGESERQLRLLFDQAYQMRPAIIFFDEIDGLAPVRSSRQDQIHSSIVSTLLALMDGLDSRGEIVIIGATNRIDAIDPALRRPGRFDREFLFPLPSRVDRLSILKIHTKAWHPPLKSQFLAELADTTVGYCGADLKGLCTEAALHALRRQYPQIYQTSEKLVLDISKINIAASDFHNALKAIVPTAQRSERSPAHALSETVCPLLVSQFHSLLSLVSFTFPPSWKAVDKVQKDLLALEGNGQGMEEWISVLRGDDNRLASRSASADPIPDDDGVPAFVPRDSDVLSVAVSSKKSSTLGKAQSQTTHSQASGPGEIPPSTRPRPLFPRNMTQSGLENPFPGNFRPERNTFSELYLSQQFTNLGEVFFDMTEMTAAEPGNPTSILEEASGPKSSRNGTQRSDSQQFLSLTSHPHTPPTPHRPRVIICGEAGMGQTIHLAPALLHTLEEIPVKVLDLSTLFGISTKTPEEACAQVFREARRVAPSVIYVPRIDSLWEVTNETFKATFVSLLLSLSYSAPVLVVGTSEAPWNNLPLSIQEVFRGLDDDSFTVRRPCVEERRRFFFHALLQKPLQPPPPKPSLPSEVPMESLPVAPPPEPRQLTEQEVGKMKRQREAVLRELRVFLREVTNKLLAERKFKELAKPVIAEEVPDYYNIITEPMDLGTVMKKIDEHRYSTPKQWLADIDLITKNALEYNPEHDSESRLLRHRAVALTDMAHSVLDHELSEDFERQCEDVEETQTRIGGSPSSQTSTWTSTVPTNPARCASSIGQTGPSTAADYAGLSIYDAPRRSLRQKGLVPVAKGLPYYAPPKPRTPKKQEEFENGGEGDEEYQESRESDTNTLELGPSIGGNEEERSQNGYLDSQDESSQGDVSVVSVDTTRGGSDRLPEGEEEVQERERSRSCHSDALTMENVGNAPLQSSLVKRQLWNGDEVERTDKSTVGSSSGRARRKSSRLSSVDSQSTPGNGLAPSSDMNYSRSMDTSETLTEPHGVPPSDNGAQTCSSSTLPVSLDRRRLLSLFDSVVSATSNCAVKDMEMLHSTITQLVFRYRMQTERRQLLEDLELVTEVFKRNHS